MRDCVWRVLEEEGFSGSFCVLPVCSVGVKGDARSYENVLELNPTEKDLSRGWSFIEKVSSRLLNEVPGINRVVIQITAKEEVS